MEGISRMKIIRDKKKRNELNTFMEKAVSFLLIQDQARSITVL